MIKYIGTFGSKGENKVCEIYLSDGNKFRYSWGKMIPFAGNKEIFPHERKASEDRTAGSSNGCF